LLSFASPFCHSAITILYVSLLIIQTPQYFPHNTPQKQFIFLFLIAQYLTTINYFLYTFGFKGYRGGKEEKRKHVENFCFAGCSKRLRGKARENRAAERT